MCINIKTVSICFNKVNLMLLYLFICLFTQNCEQMFTGIEEIKNKTGHKIYL